MKKGDKVVCIDDKFVSEQIIRIPNRPVEGDEYTIRDIFLTRNGKAVLLDEISNPPLKHPSGLGDFEPNFAQRRFVSLDEMDEFYENLFIEELVEA